MNSLVKSNLSQIKNLMTQYGVLRAYLFGSATDETIMDNNDIDFIVSFNPDLNYTDYGNNYFQLLYALQNLLKKDVDLIAEETVTNPYLLQIIDRQKVVVL